MSQKNRVIQLVKQQIAAEGENVKHITELRKKVRIAAARLILLELRFESEKHVAILTEMLEFLEGAHEDTLLWEHELEEYIDEVIVKREFEDHLKKEGGALAQLKEELKHNKDEALKLLFQNMEEDEKRHHGMVQILVRNLYKVDERGRLLK
jgi:rubrerythrin